MLIIVAAGLFVFVALAAIVLTCVRAAGIAERIKQAHEENME